MASYQFSLAKDQLLYNNNHKKEQGFLEHSSSELLSLSGLRPYESTPVLTTALSSLFSTYKVALHMLTVPSSVLYAMHGVPSAAGLMIAAWPSATGGCLRACPLLL